MQTVDPLIAAQRPTGCCSARLLDAASRRGLSRVGYFIMLNGPLNGHPPSYYYTRLEFKNNLLPLNHVGFNNVAIV